MNIISNIGKIFEVKTNLEKDDIKFYNADNAPFKVYGVFKENGKYRRMPEDIALKVNERVAWLHSNTTGGRVRFITNSSYIAINADMDGMEKAPHFAFTGSIGFDLYAGKDYIQTYIPPYDIENGYEGIIELTKRELRLIS